jgi:cyanophycinase-like exopeptidase
VIRLERDLGSLEDHPTTSFSKPLEGQIGTLSIHDVRMHVLSRGSRFNLDDRRPWEPSKWKGRPEPARFFAGVVWFRPLSPVS